MSPSQPLPAMFCVLTAGVQPSCGQDATLITMHTLASLQLTTAVWTVVALPTSGPCWSTRRQLSAGTHCGAPLARIDGAAAAFDGLGLMVFGGVGDDFGFVPSHDAWLLRGATDVHPHATLAANSAMPSQSAEAVVPSQSVAASLPSPGPAEGPCARACLSLCTTGLRAYLFGGFDGESDLNDLWTLDIRPPAVCAAAAAAATAAAATSATQAALEGTTPAFHAELFKARQARASAVLHATPGVRGRADTPCAPHHFKSAGPTEDQSRATPPPFPPSPPSHRRRASPIVMRGPHRCAPTRARDGSPCPPRPSRRCVRSLCVWALCMSRFGRLHLLSFGTRRPQGTIRSAARSTFLWVWPRAVWMRTIRVRLRCWRAPRRRRPCRPRRCSTTSAWGSAMASVTGSAQASSPPSVETSERRGVGAPGGYDAVGVGVGWM